MLAAALGACGALVLVLAPVIGVRRGMAPMDDRWQEYAFCAASVLTGTLFATWFSLMSGHVHTRDNRLDHNATTITGWQRWWLVIATKRTVVSGCFFLFLYVASSALCEKLQLGVLPDRQEFHELWRDAGLILVTFGQIVMWKWLVKPKETVVGARSCLQHKLFLGLVITLAGVPMIFGAWFPLLAFPGICVGINRHLRNNMIRDARQDKKLGT